MSVIRRTVYRDQNECENSEVLHVETFLLKTISSNAVCDY